MAKRNITRYKIKFTAGPLAGKTFSLGPGEFLYFGSGSECGVHIGDDPSISRKHACLHFAPGGRLLFKDMNSDHGTQVDGRRIRKTIRLRPGQRVTLGRHATFHATPWDALLPTRFTQIAMKKISAVARRSTIILRKKSMNPTSLAPSAARRWMVRLSIAASLIFVGLVVLEYKSNDGVGRQAARNLKAAINDRNERSEREAPRAEANDDRSVNPSSHFVWDEIVNISRRFGDAPPSAMDRAFVAEVETWITRFTKNEAHKQLFARREKYWDDIVSALRDHNLPSEIGYVVWVESAFNPGAVSPVGAAGLWQFMPETAKEYGLKVTLDPRTDERFDPAKSTQAAAQYIRALLRMFGSDRYLLALASYNTGQNRVERLKIAAAVRRARRTDFWHIHDTLPKETVDYVPKIMAAMIIGRNPDRW